jgi:Predicted phosphohydrolases
MKILHLSDFHFRSGDVSQDIVIESLGDAIRTYCTQNDQPEVFVITGDIAFSGKKQEYDKATQFIERVKSDCNIANERVFIVPGNHDVDRLLVENRQIRWWYNFTDEQSMLDVLTSSDSFPTIFKKTEAYFNFVKQNMSGAVVFGKFGEYVCQVPFVKAAGECLYDVKLIGLNSSIFCGYDNDDKNKLALSIAQITSCKKDLNPTKEIVISCLHHPFSCFHSCDIPAVNVLKKYSDLILTGHVHEPHNEGRRDETSGETVYVSSGSCFEKRTTQNGFTVINVDTSELNGSVVFYKYLPDEHEWIINKDINRDSDGVFYFKITNKMIKANQPATAQAPQADSKDNAMCYMVELNAKFDELNRTKVRSVLNQFAILLPDAKITLRKIEKGSVKFYIETGKNISTQVGDGLKQIGDMLVLDIKNLSPDHGVFDSTRIDKSILHWQTVLSPYFLENLENPGTAFTHSRVDTLMLSDLFVSPNLQAINIEGSPKSKIHPVLRSEKILSKVPDVKLRVVIYGADGCGKSTLLKWWYKTYYDNGYLPILLSGSAFNNIKIDKIKKIIETEFHKQYLSLQGVDVAEYDKDRIIVMIDDFHRVKFARPKFKANLISNLGKEYDNVIVVGNELMRFETYTSKTGSIKNLFEEYDSFQMLEFGAKLRYELIQKWTALGEEQIAPNDRIRLNQETESYVESIIGKNFIPSFPIYLMTILQAREAGTSQKPEYSLHGFYYELLINDSLSRAVKNKADISLYYNYITDYSYHLFSSKIGRNPLALEQFEEFHNNYCKEYNIDIRSTDVLETLSTAKLIRQIEGTIVLSYKYVYYFFIARYLANGISREDIRVIVRSLCQRVYRDEFASIVMFLTHLSKDQFIFNELLLDSKSIFADIKPIELSEDVLFINELIGHLPPQVYEPIDIDKVKQDDLKEKEELDNQEQEFDETKDVSTYDISEDISSLDGLSQMIRAVKTIELVGQLTKKYWGELKGPQKYELAEETFYLGLRTLGFYCGSIKHGTALLIQYLKHLYRKRHLNRVISRDEIDKMSREYLFGLCVMASYGIIKMVTNAIGYDKLAGTFSEILKNHDCNSVRLIDFSIKLDYNKIFPWEDLEKLRSITKKHFLSDVVLRNLVINYLYLFHTTVEEKQRICSSLGIEMDQQRLIDMISRVKKEN